MCDSYPDLPWDDCTDKYKHSVDFRDEFTKARDLVQRGISAWLPKQVKSATMLSQDYEVTFAWLSVLRFHELHADVPLKEVDKLKKSLTHVMNLRNEREEGVFLRPSEATRKLRLPEVRLRRTSSLALEEDLCPALQIRDKQNLGAFAWATKDRLKNRHPSLNERYAGVYTVDGLAGVVNTWKKDRDAKIDAGVVDIDSEEDERDKFRKFVRADAHDVEVGVKKRKPTSRAKAKLKARQTAMAAARAGLVDGPKTRSVVKSDPAASAAGASRSGGIVSIGTDDVGHEQEDGERSDDEGGMVDERCKMSIEAAVRGLVSVGNKLHGVTS